jgi:shikimate kinase
MTESIDHIVVVGLMGAGKSTVGSRLAERLGRVWRDSDRDIQAATGMTVRELFDRDGVDAMHARESAQLLEDLAAPEPSVISAAASVIDDVGCREALVAPGVRIVWLRASPAILAGRFASDAHRPVFGGSPEAFLVDQAERRTPWFDELVRHGAHAIDVDDRTVDEVVERALAALG